MGASIGKEDFLQEAGDLPQERDRDTPSVVGKEIPGDSGVRGQGIRQSSVDQSLDGCQTGWK